MAHKINQSIQAYDSLRFYYIHYFIKVVISKNYPLHSRYRFVSGTMTM